MDAKLKRRLVLLDDLIQVAIRIGCQFFACNGPLAPIRNQETCYRCAALHRAFKMGLVDRSELENHMPGKVRHGW